MARNEFPEDYPCPVCGEQLHTIERSESQGYGWCRTCKAWVNPAHRKLGET